MKRILRWFLKLCFGLRTYNEQVLKAKGPVMLLPNHTSWFDWILLGVFLEDDWKFVTSRQAAEVSPVHKFIMVNRYTFPVDMESPYAVKHMAEFLQARRAFGFVSGRPAVAHGFVDEAIRWHRISCSTKLKRAVITAYLRGAHQVAFFAESEPQRTVSTRVGFTLAMF